MIFAHFQTRAAAYRFPHKINSGPILLRFQGKLFDSAINMMEGDLGDVVSQSSLFSFVLFNLARNVG
jgi:hypothetical protein